MSDIDIGEIIGKMINASKEVLTDNWQEVQPYANQEFKNLAENFKLIIELKKEDKITEEQARLYIDIHKNTVKIVLLTIKGLGILTVENAINAAISVVRDSINTAIGFTVL